jgi:hypothetical protein
MQSVSPVLSSAGCQCAGAWHTVQRNATEPLILVSPEEANKNKRAKQTLKTWLQCDTWLAGFPSGFPAAVAADDARTEEARGQPHGAPLSC